MSTLPVLVPFFSSHSYCVILRQASSKPGLQSTTLLVLSQCSQEFSEKHKKQRNFGFGFVVASGIGAGFRIGVGVSVGVSVAVGVAVKFELRLNAAVAVGVAVKFELRLSAAVAVGVAVKFELRLSAVVRVGTDFAVGVRVGFDEGSEKKKMKVELLSNTTARVKNRSLIHLATRRRQQRKLTRYYSSPNLSNIGESNFS